MRTPSLLVAIVTSLTSLSIAQPAAASIVYLTQDRDIEASAFVDGQPQGGGLTAPDFADWDRSITRTFPGQNRVATASQASRLLPNAIEVTGSASVSLGQGGVPSVEGHAASILDVVFRVDEATPFQVGQSHTSINAMSGLGSRLAFARLIGPTGPVFDWIDDVNVSNSWPAGTITGTLPSGQYQLRVGASIFRTTVAGSFGSSSASVSFALSIPSVGGVGLAVVASLLTLRRRPRR